MSFSLILKDEFTGFYKSKVMIFLWVGLPILAVILHFFLSDLYVTLSTLTALLVSNIGGLLAAVMLTVNIINEKDTRVYDLFLIRPLKRWHLMISKFLAVFICVSVACLLAITLGIAVDLFHSSIPLEIITQNIIDPLIMTFSIIAISRATGILFGVAAPSILVGVILVIFVGNYISSIPSIILFAFEIKNPVNYVLAIGIIVTVVLMMLGIILFERKEF
jgi:ABC-2 type transport system permease protein